MKKNKNFKSITQEVHEEVEGTINDLMKEFHLFRRCLCFEESSEEFLVSKNELKLRKEIRQYERSLQSPEYKSVLNETIQDLLPSAKTLTEYYQSHPELTEYTMTKELRRIDYTVHTREGKKITNPSQIEAYQKENDGKNDLLWRCSNQSILGDVVSALTSCDGLIRPQMEAGTCVDHLSLLIDFRNIEPYVRAECSMTLAIPSNHEDRLPLAGVLVMVYYCPSQEKFIAQVTRLFPCPSLTDMQVNAAAKSLACFSYNPTKIKVDDSKFSPFFACTDQGEEWKERLQWYNSRLHWYQTQRKQ